MKPATIAITSIAGTLGVVAAIGFAQPDGLEPPAGPVVNTQPSLTSISAALEASRNDSGPLTAVQFRDLLAQSEVQIEAGRILLKRVVMQDGIVEIEDSAGVSLRLESGRLVFPNSNILFRDVFTYELGVELESPVTITGINSSANADLIFLYKELP